MIANLNIPRTYKIMHSSISSSLVSIFVIWKDTQYECNIFRFTETWVLAWYIVYPRKYSMLDERNAYSLAIRWNVQYLLGLLWFKSDVSLLVFCLDYLLIDKSWVLESPTIIVLEFVSLGLFSMYFWVVLYRMGYSYDCNITLLYIHS